MGLYFRTLLSVPDLLTKSLVCVLLTSYSMPLGKKEQSPQGVAICHRTLAGWEG